MVKAWVAITVAALLTPQTSCLGDHYAEELQVTPVGRDLVHVAVQMTVTSSKAADVHDFFPKKLSQLAQFVKLDRLELSFVRGVWQEAWGAQEWPAPPATQMRASFASRSKETSWVALSETLAAFASASLGFFAPEAEPEYARASLLVNQSGWDYWGFMPAEESLCTENLTPLLGLLPHRGAAGLSKLLDPPKFFATRYHALHLHYTSRDDGTHTLRVVAESVTPTGSAGSFMLELPDGGACDLCQDPVRTTVVLLPGFHDLAQDLDVAEGDVTEGPAGQKILLLPAGSPVAWQTPAPDWQPVVARGSATSVKEYAVELGDDVGTLYVEVVPSAGATAVQVIVPLPLSFLEAHVSTLRLQWAGSTQWMPVAFTAEKVYTTLALHVNATLPTQGARFILRVQYDKKILCLSEYPPDANRLYLLPPAVVRTLDATGWSREAVASAPAGVTLPSPDFSMPFNILTLSCTAIAMIFGAVFSHVTKDFSRL
eukprot:TRINITY_DN21495_c0_g1_i1.p1 TRINITY_DN21495_c0_g1~~TRINITY_DN21495_c0_g1_i1.p1  ORF type:complete len:497 (+),score=109.78 TRINITY_DN21495_c0_g1_i1:34-1491(+)